MTVLKSPLAMLPEGGAVRRPDLATDEHRAALAGLAVVEDAEVRRERAEAYATRAHDARNAQLRATVTQVLSTLIVAEDSARTAIGRQRDGLAAEDDVKAVISSERLVERPLLDVAMDILLSVVIVALYVFTEGKLLGQVVMTSGILGLLPDRFWDQLFAYAFAGAPVFWTAYKYSRQRYLKSASEREAQLRRLWWYGEVIGIPAWIAAAVFLFGPNLVPAASIANDPFAERAAFVDWLSGGVVGVQQVLQVLASLLPMLLLLGVLVGASNLVAAIWIAHRSTAERALRETVRDAEGYAFRTGALTGLLQDQINTDGQIGRLRGLADQIAADRDAFADQVCHQVEAIRASGELARRTAILEHTLGKGTVIEAGPLFARR